MSYALTHRDMKQFLLHLRRLEFVPQRIFDIGAHAGTWSQMAAGVFPQAAFTLVEPQEEMAEPLQAFCAAHPGSRWVAAGADAAGGTAELGVREDRASSTFHGGGTHRVVPMVTLDSLCEDGSSIPELVKIDVQGYEMEVLQGAERLLGRSVCWIIECSLFEFYKGQPLVQDIMQFMHRHGYRMYDLVGLLRRPLDDALAQVDIAFIRSNHALVASNRYG